MRIKPSDDISGKPAWFRNQIDRISGTVAVVESEVETPIVNKPKMTKTEQRFEREVLKPMVASGELKRYQFEGITFRMENGHRYLPDFEGCDGTRMVCFEVKGAYRLGSYQRARLAFDQCKVERPWIVWRWFELNEYGLWVEK